MTTLLRAPERDIRSRLFDAARWDGYKPRPDDIVIATYPKSGTTWTQRIVSMLVFASDEPVSVNDASPWLDMRLFGPVEPVLAQIEAQTHRRFLKSHLPYNALPVYEGMKFIHVARDGRDAAMSYHNHMFNMTPALKDRGREISLADPKFGTPPPDVSADPAQYFRDWLNEIDGGGEPRCSYFNLEKSYWAARRDPNMLLVHYNDLKADRDGEMRRIANFLEITLPETLWPRLVEAAGFETMKSQGAKIMPRSTMLFADGADRFFHKGENGRWQDIFTKDDLARYDAKVKTQISPALAAWLEHGRLVAGEPAQAAA